MATKYSNAVPGKDANAGGNQRKNMVQSVEASLKRLGTDYIDLYWLHAWDSITPAEEVMRAFDDLVRAGKILYVGISDAPAWVVAKSNTLAELRGWTRYAGLQINYSLLERTVERELIPVARDQGMTVVAWSPLHNGLLTGKYLPENRPAENKSTGSQTTRLDSEMMKGFASVDKSGLTELDESGLRTVREVVAIAKETGTSPAQVALAWLRYRSVPVIPIIGARKLNQLEDNLKSLEISFSPEQLRRLDDTSAVPMGFPHDLLSGVIRGTVFGGMRDRIIA